MRRSHLWVGLAGVVTPVVFALTIGFGPPRHSEHFCAGGGAVGAPVGASPKAAVLAYVGPRARDWVRQNSGISPGLRYAPKGNACGVVVAKTNGGWQVTDNLGS